MTEIQSFCYTVSLKAPDAAYLFTIYSATLRLCVSAVIYPSELKTARESNRNRMTHVPRLFSIRGDA